MNSLLEWISLRRGGLNQLQIIHSAFAPNSLRIYSDNFLQCMNVNNECFDICNTHPEKEDESITPLFIGGF
jgi:hypothetical protein